MQERSLATVSSHLPTLPDSASHFAGLKRQEHAIAEYFPYADASETAFLKTLRLAPVTNLPLLPLRTCIALGPGPDRNMVSSGSRVNTIGLQRRALSTWLLRSPGVIKPLSSFNVVSEYYQCEPLPYPTIHPRLHSKYQVNFHRNPKRQPALSTRCCDSTALPSLKEASQGQLAIKVSSNDQRNSEWGSRHEKIKILDIIQFLRFSPRSPAFFHASGRPR